MKNINDSKYRKTLIERFLDCDTSVEEERALASYYRRCKEQGSVSRDEMEICELVLTTISLPSKVSGNNFGKFAWRKTVAWIAAAVAVVLCVMTFGMEIGEDDTSLHQKTAVSMPAKQYVANALVLAEKSARQVPTVASDASSAEVRAVHTRRKADVGAVRSATTIARDKSVAADIKEVYDVATLAFHDASSIFVESKGSAAMVSATWSDGSVKRYVACASDGDGSFTLVEI